MAGRGSRSPLCNKSGRSIAGVLSYGRLPYENISHSVTPATLKVKVKITYSSLQETCHKLTKCYLPYVITVLLATQQG